MRATSISIGVQRPYVNKDNNIKIILNKIVILSEDISGIHHLEKY